ncbi:MAG TPA: pyridoxal-dependent decarboxylase [Bacteroidales bacterium]|jgi:glutamate/tyrosine decarboxylase-like PLP-dependent enzyme|nr:pyridoxal-dependent decarboxylase [Bacteroidales bacterium]
MNDNALSPVEISKEEFRKIGYQLVDSVSEFIDGIDKRRVTTGESPQEIAGIVGSPPLPEEGSSPEIILKKVSDLLFDHSLLNGHPKFFGYITSSPSPVGALADLLAAAVNPNVGANILSPAATEIEKQTVSWLAGLTGLSSYDGLLVSGGNMANFTGFLAARTAKAPDGAKTGGLSAIDRKMVCYCSKATHAWIEKASILFGLGTDAIRWIDTEMGNRIDISALREAVQTDMSNGLLPFLVIGNAGDVSTGAIDDLGAIASVCIEYDMWFHVDGAYGLPASLLPELKERFSGITSADSVAIDPHKWLYCPLEAGCILVKDPVHLKHAFSIHPVYYNFDEEDPSIRNYYEYGLQNSRGFRALKVWCTLQQVGRKGYEKLIGHDIRMARLLYTLAQNDPELEPVTQNLSITTLRYRPSDYNYSEQHLNELNEKLLNELQKGGEVFLSNAVIDGRYCLRACIVNFRTREKDIEEAVEIIVREGKRVHEEWRKETVAEGVAQAGS